MVLDVKADSQTILSFACSCEVNYEAFVHTNDGYRRIVEDSFVFDYANLVSVVAPVKPFSLLLTIFGAEEPLRVPYWEMLLLVL